MLLGSGAHALAQVLPGGQPSALRPVSLHAAAGPPVLAPAPGDEPAYPRTPAAVAQPHFGSRGRLLSAAILFAVSRGVRHDLTGTGGGSPRQMAAQDETDPTRCLSSTTECPTTLEPRQRARRFLVMSLVPQSSRCPAALAEFPPRPTLVHPFPAPAIGAVPPPARVEPSQSHPSLQST